MKGRGRFVGEGWLGTRRLIEGAHHIPKRKRSARVAYSAGALRQSRVSGKRHVSGKYWRTTGAGRAGEEGAKAKRRGHLNVIFSTRKYCMLAAGAATGMTPFIIIACRPSPGREELNIGGDNSGLELLQESSSKSNIRLYSN